LTAATSFGTIHLARLTLTLVLLPLHLGGRTVQAMGKIFYDGDGILEIPDRTLQHLQLAIVAKLRRQEHFTLTWVGDRDAGPNVVWISPHIPLRFKFDGPLTKKLNRDWIEAMIVSANHGNLIAMDEPEA
jgi:hypothetical protein